MWNNPSCSRCATARATLAEAGVPVRLRAYLDDPPDVAELADVLRRLGAQPWDICRLAEPAAAGLGMGDWPREAGSVDQWLAAMVDHPELIQRPIILLDDGSATVARTPEALNQVLRASGASAAPRASGVSHVDGPTHG
jgi:arsenate reductase (glutaredoxin)